MQFANKVGEGTFKQTFKIICEDGSPVALKIFKPGASSERNHREFDAMVKCDHPNIAKLHSVGLFDFGGKLVLTAQEEFLAGGVLPPQISIPECLSYGSQLISAVSHLRQLGLVHRDLKPDNIMFRDDGKTPVIVDFGLVRNLAEASITPTWLSHGPGTPFFASPEQLNNDKHLIGWRSDQFSLGVAFSFTCLGVHPFAEAADASPWDAVSRIAARQVPSAAFIERTKQELPALAKMVSPWPVQRYRLPGDLALAWNTQKGKS